MIFFLIIVFAVVGGREGNGPVRKPFRVCKRGYSAEYIKLKAEQARITPPMQMNVIYMLSVKFSLHYYQQ